MRIVNLTPHALTIEAADGTWHHAIPSDGVARVSETRADAGTVGPFAVTTVRYGDVTGLPPETDGVACVVSAMVKAALPSRQDLYSPGSLVRDASGQPVGCKGLTR
jgi:hypothetical protein